MRTPGFGDSNWTDIISELRLSGYSGSIDIEGWHDPVYRDALEMTGQIAALEHLKRARGGDSVNLAAQYEGATPRCGAPVERGVGFAGGPEAIDAESWMHTGDLATIDAEGYCNAVGRVKEMVIRGGENVYPREVEEFLYRYPKVREVQVFGVPDDRYGEEICAWIVPQVGEQPSEEEIRAFCEDLIAHYKVPRCVCT